MTARLSHTHRTMLEKARNPGTSAMGVRLSHADCAFLVATVARDLGSTHLFPELDFAQIPDFFATPPTSATAELPLGLEPALARLFTELEDADTYFSCLASLHQSRLKYDQISKRQPFPTFEQVGPRGLIQYGTFSTQGLMTLMTWRKWLYDLDNRAAQDTGYLFEPILAHAIGGAPFSARNSPVKRVTDSSKGRQVDCVRGDNAYVFKLRVTIAASGQGRWGQELSFPADCRASGFTPILIVLDATPNPKLTELTQQFESAGGRAFIGDAAWQHLQNEAGPSMGVFLEKYVRLPLASLLAESEKPLLPLSLRLIPAGVEIVVGDDVIVIDRQTTDAPQPPDGMPGDINDGLPGV